jgi:hypothetical protein
VAAPAVSRRHCSASPVTCVPLVRRRWSSRSARWGDTATLAPRRAACVPRETTATPLDSPLRRAAVSRRPHPAVLSPAPVPVPCLLAHHAAAAVALSRSHPRVRVRCRRRCVASAAVAAVRSLPLWLSPPSAQAPSPLLVPVSTCLLVARCPTVVRRALHCPRAVSRGLHQRSTVKLHRRHVR